MLVCSTTKSYMFGKIKRKKKLQKFSPKNYRVRKETSLIQVGFFLLDESFQSKFSILFRSILLFYKWVCTHRLSWMWCLLADAKMSFRQISNIILQKVDAKLTLCCQGQPAGPHVSRPERDSDLREADGRSILPKLLRLWTS